jgi:hypothetical protein
MARGKDASFIQAGRPQVAISFCIAPAAIMARANAIGTKNATQNTGTSIRSMWTKFGALYQTADGTLIHQYHPGPQLVLDKIDGQAAGIVQDRATVVANLKNAVPGFCQLLQAH